MVSDGSMPRSAVLLLLGALACSGTTLPNLDDAVRDSSSVLPVFPGAEGFGTDTSAGRKGAVLVVTTLADSGEGSLRWALSQPGPRTVVFEVGGVIETKTSLEVHEPFITVAGQTAPAPGITLFGAGLSIQTHDVLVQHLAFRPGDAPDGPDPNDRDALQIIGNARGLEVFNVVIDHVSLSWAIDEGFSTWYPGVHDVTVSNSLVAECVDASIHPKGKHSKGFLIGDHTRRFAMLRNLLAHNDDRNPFIKGDTSSLVVNNFVYDPGRWPVGLFDEEGAGPSLTTLQGNDFVLGPSSNRDDHTMLISPSMKTGTRVHLADNRGWDLQEGQQSLVDAKPGHRVQFVDAPTVSVKPLTVLPVAMVEARVVANAGSRPRARDAVDARIISTVTARSGRIIDRVSEVAFTPPSPTRMPLVLPAEPAGDADGDGYTNLEEWLHERSRAVSAE